MNVLDGLKASTFSANVYFWVNYSFNANTITVWKLFFFLIMFLLKMCL